MNLLGTWFIVIGQLLYPITGDHWDEKSHASIHKVRMIFCATVAAVWIISVMIGIIVFRKMAADIAFSKNDTDRE